MIISKISPAEVKAIKALNDFLSEGGDISRVYGHVKQKQARDKLLKRLKKSNSRNASGCAWWLKKKNRPSNWYNQLEHLALDHTSFYEDKETGARSIITEPYHINEKTILHLAEQIKEHSLSVEINAMDSIWYPSETIYVEFKLNDCNT